MNRAQKTVHEFLIHIEFNISNPLRRIPDSLPDAGVGKGLNGSGQGNIAYSLVRLQEADQEACPESQTPGGRYAGQRLRPY